ncbi:hypothetical protein [Pseudomonas sp. BE134]|uniref:hypothetical protein n=1 Tax=Pseudomonas sp. BE134 TaxID=2817843 RepID=UPI0028621052|nr:hypothetical protein [Pseudomonas sp. BE134]MDR6927849.1 hypothetical protein [Pseudomonas sp. BE134]
MRFSLDKYSTAAKPAEQPEWVTSDTKRNLYQAVCTAYEHIKSEIETGKNLSLKQRKIVARNIAKEGNVHDSLLNKRRQPEIHELIFQQNIALENLWNSHAARRYKTGRKLTKNQILNESRTQAQEIERLSNLRIAEALSVAIENHMVDSHKTLIVTIEHLEAENADLQLRNSELSKQLRQMMKALNMVKGK